MKSFLKYSLILTLLVTPLFAAKSSQTVTISQAVSVGSTKIAAGDYRVSWEGAGPAVKVTLAKSGTTPIILDAKLVTAENGGGSVLIGTENGVRILQEIDLAHASLMFGAAPAAQ